MATPSTQAEPVRERPELLVVGGGIAGGALAAAAARAGIGVLLVEKSLEHRDRVRGEFMPPWGVREAQQLGVLDAFLAAGAHYVRQYVGYGEDIDPQAAERRAIALDSLIPGVEGALTFGHPQVCTALDAAAVAAGAQLLRGVTEIRVDGGAAPEVSFVHEGVRHVVSPKLVAAADGRGSSIARSLGAVVHTEPARYLLCGMLVDGVPEWPEDTDTIGTEGDLLFYVFPQGHGRLRLYAGYALEDRGRFSGHDNAQRLLQSFQLRSVPPARSMARARPAGPCNSYPGGDSWLDRLGVPGVVFIGDAAGHTCPTIGQGVSSSLRDARHVVDALVSERHWSEQAGAAYAEERNERMKRLRFVAHLFSDLRCDFSAAARQRRRAVFARIAAEPALAAPLFATQVGPFAFPSPVFTQEARQRLLGE